MPASGPLSLPYVLWPLLADDGEPARAPSGAGVEGVKDVASGLHLPPALLFPMAMNLGVKGMSGLVSACL